MRKNTVPATDALLALPTWVCVMLRSSRMMGISGAAMNVEQKLALDERVSKQAAMRCLRLSKQAATKAHLMKKENQARWKAVMCGNANDHRRMVVALFSLSTGRENLEDWPPLTAGAGQHA